MADVSERELYNRALDHVRGLRECFRGLALHRGDERWLMPARLMDALEDNVKSMMFERAARWLMPGHDRNK